MVVRRPHVTYASVTSTLALVLVLSGAAYAGAQLPKNSVKSKQIKDGQVQTADVKDNGLSGTDIAESSLAMVPSAANADAAATVGSATTAGTVDDSAKLGGQLPDVYAPPGSEAWTAATLNDGVLPSSWEICGWRNYGVGGGPTFPAASFSRDPSGVVRLQGVVQAHDGANSPCGDNPGFDQVIFTLPAGYRPEFPSVLSVTSNNAPGRVDVGANGVVSISPDYPTWSSAMTWVSLDGLSFRCYPSGSDGCP